MQHDVVKLQIERLDVLPIPKDGPCKIKRAVELVRVIGTYADDEDHLTEAIDRILDNCEWYPLPAILKAALIQTRPASIRDGGATNPTDFVPHGCARCGFTGYVTVKRGGIEYAKRCECLKTRIAELGPEIGEDSGSRVLTFARGA